MRSILIIAVTALVAGCAVATYTPPTRVSGETNVKLIDKSRDEVWAAAVPQVGKNFFVINNIDRTSGLMNVSYTGDPARYVDCGTVTVQDPLGRTVTLAAASPELDFTAFEGSGAGRINQRMSVVGRLNLIFEELTPNKTRVTAAGSYVLSRQRSVHALGGNLLSFHSATATLTTGGVAKFTDSQAGQGTTCVNTGLLEADLLALIN